MTRGINFIEMMQEFFRTRFGVEVFHFRTIHGLLFTALESVSTDNSIGSSLTDEQRTDLFRQLLAYPYATDSSYRLYQYDEESNQRIERATYIFKVDLDEPVSSSLRQFAEYFSACTSDSHKDFVNIDFENSYFTSRSSDPENTIIKDARSGDYPIQKERFADVDLSAVDFDDEPFNVFILSLAFRDAEVPLERTFVHTGGASYLVLENPTGS